jgi:hypothetical protein
MFDSRGLLPQDFTIKLADFSESFFINGNNSALKWNKFHRKILSENFIALASVLKEFGVHKVLVDGSFVTSKFEPNDIDGCYSIEMAEFVRLVKYNPIFDMSRRINGKPKMWAERKVELFPDFGQAASFDADGNGIPFPSFFRMTRNGQKKGLLIVELNNPHD